MRTSGGWLVSTLMALTAACGSDPAPPRSSDAGAVDAPTSDAPVADLGGFDAPPAIDASSVDSAVDDTASVDVAADVPSTDVPSTDVPSTDVPSTDAPVIDAAVLDAPVLDAPVLDAPVLDAPVLDAPVLDAPIDAPSTDLPPVHADTGCPPASGDAGPTLYCGGACRDTSTDVAHCGRCDNACAAGTPCVAGVCEPRAPRAIAPMSTSTVTSQQPTLRWLSGANTEGTRVELCRDRAMTRSCLAPIDVTAASARPAAPLAPGVWFWRLTGLRAGAGVTATTPTWQFTVGARSAPRDGSWGSTLDVNGDGFADMAVGSSERIYVYAGSAAGLATAATTVPTPPGRTVASAGDVNGDGFGDLLAGSSSRLGVFLGGPSGLTATPILRQPGSPLSPTNDVTALGDVNGDGYADVAVGHYLFLGSASGPAATATTVNGPSGEPYAGAGLLGVGDVDGDGFSDVVTRTPTVSGNHTLYLYRGSPTGLGARTPLPTPVGSVRLGSAFASAGDVNGDGLNDVLVGDYGSLQGFVFLGDPSGLSVAAAPLAGYGTRLYAGFLSGAGDLDGDGYSDVAMGTEASSVIVYFGGASGVPSTPTTLSPPAGTYALNAAMIGLGDVDGDGFGELAVGSSSSARVFVYRGGASGLPESPTTTFLGPATVFYGDSIARVGVPRRAESFTRSPSPA